MIFNPLIVQSTAQTVTPAVEKIERELRGTSLTQRNAVRILPDSIVIILQQYLFTNSIYVNKNESSNALSSHIKNQSKNISLNLSQQIDSYIKKYN